MGLARLVTRRNGTSSIVPVVVLGAAVSLGVVALTASRFGWRRTKADKQAAEAPEAEGQVVVESAPEAEPARPAPRFKPAPPRDPDAPRWDDPPAELAAARAKPDPPSP
jgi:hypothetical protein